MLALATILFLGLLKRYRPANTFERATRQPRIFYHFHFIYAFSHYFALSPATSRHGMYLSRMARPRKHFAGHQPILSYFRDAC